MTAPAETVLQAPQGPLQLRRYPPSNRDVSLRAWDAADDYLLQHLDISGQTADSVWILNDSFGALTTAMTCTGSLVSMSSDSWLAHEGTRANLQINSQDPARVSLLTSLESPSAEMDLVLIRVPGSLALLQDQLHRVRQHLLSQPEGDVRIVGAAMAKNVHTSTLDLFASILGPTTTSLARRKARLILCQFDATLQVPPTPHPETYSLGELSQPIMSHAGVFSRRRLDAGTGHLLPHIPAGDVARDIVDLGCGNGVIGLVAAGRNPAAQVTFVDESFMAVASARQNWQRLYGDRIATFDVGDGADPLPRDGADLILCNPPFHQQSARSDATAWRMFSGARKALQANGQLLVVGNRHLAYHAKLRRLFGNCDVLSSDRRFVVLRSQLGQVRYSAV